MAYNSWSGGLAKPAQRDLGGSGDTCSPKKIMSLWIKFGAFLEHMLYMYMSKEYYHYYALGLNSSSLTGVAPWFLRPCLA